MREREGWRRGRYRQTPARGGGDKSGKPSYIRGGCGWMSSMYIYVGGWPAFANDTLLLPDAHSFPGFSAARELRVAPRRTPSSPPPPSAAAASFYQQLLLLLYDTWNVLHLYTVCSIHARKHRPPPPGRFKVFQAGFHDNGESANGERYVLYGKGKGQALEEIFPTP